MDPLPSLIVPNDLNISQIKQDLGPRLDGGFSDGDIYIQEVFYDWRNNKEVDSSRHGQLDVERVRKVTIKRSLGSQIGEGFKAVALSIIGNGLDAEYGIDAVNRNYIETTAKEIFSGEALNSEIDATRDRKEYMAKAFVNCQQIVFYASLESTEVIGPFLQDPGGIKTICKIAKIGRFIFGLAGMVFTIIQIFR